MGQKSELDLLNQKFLQGAEELVRLVQSLDDHGLDKCLAPGEWTIRQILHHLTDDGDIYGFIIKRAMATPGAKVTFEGFPGNEVWASALSNMTRPAASSLELISAQRRALSDLVMANSDKSDQTATFIGEDGKEIPFNVRQMIEMLTEHLSEHLETIVKIKEKHNLA